LGEYTILKFVSVDILWVPQQIECTFFCYSYYRIVAYPSLWRGQFVVAALFWSVVFCSLLCYLWIRGVLTNFSRLILHFFIWSLTNFSRLILHFFIWIKYNVN
jgi:hypothetical protein